MTSVTPNKIRKDYSILDFTRGIAAIMVFVGHLRTLMFVPSFDLKSTNYFIKLFYFLTGFGHQAVIIFFVLSGFFITKSVMSNFSSADSTFNWSFYLGNRLTRLLIVLLPSLVFTFVIDKAGGIIFPGSIYYHHIFPDFPVVYPGLNSTWQIFLGNLFFLGDFYFPTFGTNCALWSLSYEFWFYLLFPALLITIATAFLKSSKKLQWLLIFSLIIIIGTALIVPLRFYGYFFIWLLGSLLYYLKDRDKVIFKLRVSFFITILAFLQFAGAIILGRSGVFGLVSMTSDMLVGCSFFIFLLFINDYGLTGGWRKIATYISEMSYTVYLFHVSTAVFVCNFLIKSRYNVVGIKSILIYLAGFIIVFISCRLFYRLFEANTSKLRLLMKGRPMLTGTV